MVSRILQIRAKTCLEKNTGDLKAKLSKFALQCQKHPQVDGKILDLSLFGLNSSLATKPSFALTGDGLF